MLLSYSIISVMQTLTIDTLSILSVHDTAPPTGRILSETVGVLAHGLDDIYPRGHRDTALKMIKQGGLLSEYTTHTQPVARNFVQRNRIVAGCADATILIESAAKGGGLITCSIARSYGREVFAFPGAVHSDYSEGCNNLIRDNGAALITSATDFVKAMGWDDDIKLGQAQQRGIERTLFPDLSSEEEAIVRVLAKNNDLQINLLSILISCRFKRIFLSQGSQESSLRWK